jgi:1-acyl-sn-glycerol-3-phosphate acyltransferase
MLSIAGTQILAGCLLAGIGLTLLVLTAIWIRQTRFTTPQAFVFLWNYVMARVLWRAEVCGSLPPGPNEGAVIICNHRCPIDPSFIALGTDQAVRWMVAGEYCRHWLTGWMLRICAVIPTNRSGVDTASTKEAIRHAKQGGMVGLFPEGRINETDQILLPGRPGVAMIALRARAVVIPCYVSGSPYDGTILGCFLMPAKVRLTIGQPIDLSAYYGQETDRQVLGMLTKRFLSEIAKLGGAEDFEPQLAGRFYKPKP